MAWGQISFPPQHDNLNESVYIEPWPSFYHTSGAGAGPTPSQHTDMHVNTPLIVGVCVCVCGPLGQCRELDGAREQKIYELPPPPSVPLICTPLVGDREKEAQWHSPSPPSLLCVNPFPALWDQSVPK